MAEHYMYFGTAERMTWIKCPNSGMGRNRVGWGASGTYLNGGGWSRESTTKHFEPTLTWSFLNHIQVRAIEDYWLGLYGSTPIYWMDTFAMGTNVLPAHWSVPRLAADDAPPLVIDRRPTLSDTAANDIALPTKTATYEFKEGDSFAQVYIPVPDGFTAHVALWGVATGTAVMRANTTNLTLTSPGISDPTWNHISGVSGITLAGFGLGTLSLAGMMVQVLPNSAYTMIPGLMTSSGLMTSPSLVTQTTTYLLNGAPPGTPRFLSGAGHSGVKFKSAPTVVGYSAPHAIDYQSLTAEFIEVGSWQQ